jgi:hypothetical protein
MNSPDSFQYLPNQQGSLAVQLPSATGLDQGGDRLRIEKTIGYLDASPVADQAVGGLSS